MKCDLMSKFENESEPKSDQEDLLDRLKKRHDEAWLKVYPKLRRHCMGVLLRMSVPEEDAEEIAHDAVLEAVRCDCYEQLSSLKELTRFVGSITKFRGLDWFNKKKSQKRGGGKVDSLDEQVGEHGQTRIDRIVSDQKGFSPIEKMDLLPALRGCLEEYLSEKDSFLIRKFFLEEWTQAEIAEKFGFKIGGIGTTIKRALNKLKQCLDHKGVQSPFCA